MNNELKFSNYTIFRFWLILLMLLLAVALVYLAKDALVMIGISIFLAIAINPLVVKLSSKISKKGSVSQKHRIIATTIIVFGITLFFILFCFFAIPLLINQLVNFLDTAPATIAATIAGLKEHQFVEKFNLVPLIDNAIYYINDSRQVLITQFGSTIINSAPLILSWLFSGLIVLTLTVMILIDAPAILNSFWKLFNKQSQVEHYKSMATQMSGAVVGFVNGQLLLVCINGFFSSLAVFVLYLLFPINSSLILPAGLLVAVVGLIPWIGTTIGSVLAAILIMFSSVPAACVFLIFCIIYQQIANSVIAPYIQARALDLSSLVVFISITLGFYLFGILGGTIAIPIASCIKILITNNNNLTSFKIG